jgi:hypothetical protein
MSRELEKVGNAALIGFGVVIGVRVAGPVCDYVGRVIENIGNAIQVANWRATDPDRFDEYVLSVMRSHFFSEQSRAFVGALGLTWEEAGRIYPKRNKEILAAFRLSLRAALVNRVNHINPAASHPRQFMLAPTSSAQPTAGKVQAEMRRGQRNRLLMLAPAAPAQPTAGKVQVEMPAGPRNKLQRDMLVKYDRYIGTGLTDREACKLIIVNAHFKRKHKGDLKRAVYSLVRKYRTKK